MYFLISAEKPRFHWGIFIYVGIAISLLMVFGLLSCNENSPQFGSITVVTYGGGDYVKSHSVSFSEPYTYYSGHGVTSVVWNADYGRLKNMVESGKVDWDVVEVTAAQYQRGLIDSLYQKLTQLPNDGRFIEGTVTEYGVGNVYWGTVLAYSKALSREKVPNGWADFFNTTRYPGKRALYDDPRGNLEYALLADGVTKEKLYPLDVDRAFAKLEKIKPYVAVWWTDGSQPVQLLATNTVTYTSAWSGRIFGSENARQSIAYTWSGGALELDYWVVPRGSIHAELGSRFISFASSPYQMAKQAAMVGYGPVNLSALNYVDESVRKELPTYPDNLARAFVVDAGWWSEHEVEVKSRWLNWKSR